MAQPVYKMFYGRMKEAWYQLPREKQDEIWAQMQENFKRIGGKPIIICDSGWSSEKWQFWGVEEYPSLEALQEYSNCLSELDWFRYCDSEILLGAAITPASA